jgi:hypothetical protein
MAAQPQPRLVEAPPETATAHGLTATPLPDALGCWKVQDESFRLAGYIWRETETVAAGTSREHDVTRIRAQLAGSAKPLKIDHYQGRLPSLLTVLGDMRAADKGSRWSKE